MIRTGLGRRAFLAGAVALAGLAGAARGAPPPLRIGHLRRGRAFAPGGDAFGALRRALAEDEDLRAALAEEGYGGVVFFPSDDPADLRRRLDAFEHDAAFVPAPVFAAQAAGYRVVLQERRSGDIVNPRGGSVLQRGVGIARAGSALFRADPEDAAAIAAELARTPLAVPASQSLAGFVAPMLEMARRYSLSRFEGGLVWYPSSSDVAKAVLSGLVEAGVCEDRAHEAVLAEAGLEARADSVRRVLFRTNPVPTDPVVFRPELANAGSRLGAELRRALREASLAGAFGGTTLQPASDADYGGVAELLREFEAVLGVLRP